MKRLFFRNFLFPGSGEYILKQQQWLQRQRHPLLIYCENMECAPKCTRLTRLTIMLEDNLPQRRLLIPNCEYENCVPKHTIINVPGVPSSHKGFMEICSLNFGTSVPFIPIVFDMPSVLGAPSSQKRRLLIQNCEYKHCTKCIIIYNNKCTRCTKITSRFHGHLIT